MDGASVTTTEKKRKVLFVAHHLTVGGAQKSMINALKAIDYSQNDVTLYVRKKRLDLIDEIDSRVHVIVNEDTTHYYRNFYSAWMLLCIKLFGLLRLVKPKNHFKEKLDNHIMKRMREYEYTYYFAGKQYDVAISYVQGYTADLVAYSVDAKRKFIFYHSSTDEAHKFHEDAFKYFDGIVAVGDSVKEILVSLYPEFQNKIHVIYNCVDYELIRKKSKAFDVPKAANKTTLCTCGRLSPVKGFDLAVKAANRLKEAGILFVWYFVGDGPERGKIEALIREYHLEEEIIITGMQENPYPWMRACDIYVQPSYEDAQPLSVIEAQILCKPVVSTATVGGKTLIKNMVNGIVCDIDSRSLAAVISHLAESPSVIADITSVLKSEDFQKKRMVYVESLKKLLTDEK